MKCTKCGSSNVLSKSYVKTNMGERILYTLGAGALAVGGMVTLPLPGLHYVGLACLFGAGTVGKGIPSKETILRYKYKCLECGNKWE